MLTSREEFAKYPFTKEAVEYIKSLGLRIDELASPEYLEIINIAERRIEEALINRIVKQKESPMREEEILSFPIAMILVAAIGDDFLKRRYALAEAERVDILLRSEKEEKLIEISELSFNWKVKKLDLKISFPYDYAINFANYLKIAPHFHDYKWKLVNRTLMNGEVLLKKEELARLISEEVRLYIQKRIESSPRVKIPALLAQRVERISQILAQRRDSIRMEEFPKSAINAAFPPCVKRLYDSLLASQHLSHLGRFTLTSFLLNLGMSSEELLKLYTSVSDFSEKLTKYQIEHIAGKKGSGTRYNPPSCDTLRTHGLCQGSDDLCAQSKHPLSYYQRKIRLMKTIGGKKIE